jgi:hypothetical protein
MKIVDTDIFAGDYPNEQLIADHITNKEMGEVMVECRRITVEEIPE